MVNVLALDIGGTSIKGGHADRSGLQGDPWKYSTEEVGSAEELVELLEQDATLEIDAIGVAAAGVVNRDEKRLVEVANWSGWNLDPVAQAFGVPLILENDADASALGLKTFGDVDEDANLAYLTISTGIGVGVLRNGELVPGAEAGFENLNWDGTVWHAGIHNPWEGYASGANIGDRVREWLACKSRETMLTGREDAKGFSKLYMTVTLWPETTTHG